MKQTQVFRVQVPAQTRWDRTTGATVVVKPAFIAKVAVDVDFAALAKDLGVKAAKSKSAKSVDAGGAVQARFIHTSDYQQPNA